MKSKRLIIIILFIFSANLSFGQSYSISTQLDSSKYLIGDYLKFHLLITVPNNASFIFPQVTETQLGLLEFIEKSAIDTIHEATRTQFRQTITATAFDTGQYKFPSLQLLSTDSIILAKSDSILFSITTLPVDTTLAIKDIKPMAKVPITFKEVLPYLLIGGGIITLIVLFIWFFIKYGKKKLSQSTRISSKPKEKAHIIALKELEKLRLRKLWQEGHIKLYYSELTDIVRTYYKNRWDIDAMEMTSGEILEETEKRGINQELLNKLLFLFTTADLVKFAKSEPLPNDHDTCFKNAHIFISETAEADNNSN